MRTHRLPIGSTLLLLSAALAAAAGDGPATPRAPAELGPFVRQWVSERLTRYDIPGAVVAIVRDGEVLLVGGYGMADLERQVPMNGETTVIRVGSVSKAVTSSLALLEVQRGHIGLDQDLRPLFADLAVRPPLSSPLTLHQLLTFTGGFDERLFGQHVRAASAYRPLARFLRDELPPRFAEPGAVVSYNDFQTSLVGYALERTRNERFEALAAREILGPLGMTSTTFEQVDLPDGLAARIARAYTRRGSSLVAYPRDYVATTPAAGLYTTGGDMARYMLAVLASSAPGLELMPPSQWQRQWTRQSAMHPRLPAWAYGFAEDRVQQRTGWFKDGQASGFHARMLLVPELKLGVFCAINRNIFGAMGNTEPAARFVRELGDAILATFFPVDSATASEPVPPTPAPGFALRAARYEGTYRTTVASRHTPEKLVSMFDDVAVRAGRNGALMFGDSRWIEVEPGVAQWHEGGPHFIAFGGEDGGRYRHLFIARSAYERVPWWTGSRSTLLFLVAQVAIALVVLGSWAVWRRRARSSPATAAGLSGSVALAAARAGLDIAFFGGLAGVLLLADTQTFFLGLPWALRIVLAAPLLSAVCWLALVVSLVEDWRQGRGTRAGRLALAAYALLGATVYPWLAYWRLVGLWLS